MSSSLLIFPLRHVSRRTHGVMVIGVGSQRRQSSGGCRFNPHYRRVTIQEYLTLVPGYGWRNQNRSFNKGRSSRFREVSWVRQTPKEGRRTYRPKRCRNNNKYEDNSPKTLNDKNGFNSCAKFFVYSVISNSFK